MPRSRTEQLIVSLVIGLLTAVLVVLTVANPGDGPSISDVSNRTSQILDCGIKNVGNAESMKRCEDRVYAAFEAGHQLTWMQENQALTGLVAGLAAFGLALGIFAFISPQPRT